VKKKILLVSLAFLLAIGLVATACAAPAPPAPEVIEWDASFWGGPGARVWPVWPWYEEEIFKRTDGRFKVTIHHGSALSPSKEQLDGLKAGLYQMAHWASAYHPGKNPLASFFDIPGMYPDVYKEQILLELAFQEHPDAMREMEAWNAVYIGLSHTRPPYEFMGPTPIRSLADFKGQRMRVPGLAGRLIEQFGAVALLIPAPEVYEALSKGTLDQSFFAPASQAGYKINEVSKYYTYNLGMGCSMCWFLVANKDAWEALPEDIKAIHWELVEELMLERLPTEMLKKVDELFAEWEKEGIEFIEFPDEDKATLMAAAEDIAWEYAAEVDAKGLPGTEMLEWLIAKKKEIAGK